MIARIVVVLSLLLVAGYGYYRYLNRTVIDSLPVVEYESNPAITKGHQPKICTGIETKDYSALNDSTEFCPPNTALIGLEDASSRGLSGEPSSVALEGVCCPLPAEDILSDEHVYNVDKECPSNFIATGNTPPSCGAQCFFRCTRINTERYSLGAKHQAVYWKRPDSYPAAGAEGASQILLSDIPWAVRYGISPWAWLNAEKGLEAWDQDGCMGVPFGAVAVEKRGPGCGGLYFRHLYFRETGKAVRMYPECEGIEGMVEEKPRCRAPGDMPEEVGVKTSDTSVSSSKTK